MHAWNDDDDLDDGAYDDDDITEDDGADVIPCPECGADIYEDAEQCPVCGSYVIHRSGSGSVWSGRPIWWIAFGALGIAMVLLTLALASTPG